MTTYYLVRNKVIIDTVAAFDIYQAKFAFRSNQVQPAMIGDQIMVCASKAVKCGDWEWKNA